MNYFKLILFFRNWFSWLKTVVFRSSRCATTETVRKCDPSRIIVLIWGSRDQGLNKSRLEQWLFIHWDLAGGGNGKIGDLFGSSCFALGVQPKLYNLRDGPIIWTYFKTLIGMWSKVSGKFAILYPYKIAWPPLFLSCTNFPNSCKVKIL